MTKISTKKALLVVIYPYKFTDFVYSYMELVYFKPYAEILIWDISMLTSPTFSKAVSASRSGNDDVLVIVSLCDLIRRVLELKKRSTTENICVVNVVNNSTINEFICNLLISAFLKSAKLAILDLYNGGIPMRIPNHAAQPDEFALNDGLWSKAVRFVRNTSTFSEALKKISALLFSTLARWLPSPVTHRLVAGEDWQELARLQNAGKNNIKIIDGYCFDYSNSLASPLSCTVLAPRQKKTAVLLDAAGPMFGSDYKILGRKVYLTSDVWYPALSRFFDRLESQTGAQIKIAGHYKATHPPIAPCFGNRSVYYGKTNELVRNSDFVITRSSSAISYAVMFRKPVIFIYSNQLKEDRMIMRDIFGLAGMLGTKPVNIDEPDVDISRFLKVNEEKYLNYENVCLRSSTSQRPNYKIILEDVMDIAVDD